MPGWDGCIPGFYHSFKDRDSSALCFCSSWKAPSVFYKASVALISKSNVAGGIRFSCEGGREPYGWRDLTKTHVNIHRQVAQSWLVSTEPWWPQRSGPLLACGATTSSRCKAVTVAAAITLCPSKHDGGKVRKGAGQVLALLRMVSRTAVWHFCLYLIIRNMWPQAAAEKQETHYSVWSCS